MLLSSIIMRCVALFCNRLPQSLEPVCWCETPKHMGVHQKAERRRAAHKARSEPCQQWWWTPAQEEKMAQFGKKNKEAEEAVQRRTHHARRILERNKICNSLISLIAWLRYCCVFSWSLILDTCCWLQQMCDSNCMDAVIMTITLLFYNVHVSFEVNIGLIAYNTIP